MIRNIANRVTSDGIEAFDVELGDFQAVGQIIDQVHKRIAYESIIGTARAAIERGGLFSRRGTLSCDR